MPLTALKRLLKPEFFLYGGCVFLRGVASARLYRAYRTGVPLGSPLGEPDRTGAEAFENHLHTQVEVAPYASVRVSSGRVFREAELLGQVLAHLWASHLSRAFPRQRFRVYYSRSNDPTVRFHRAYRGEVSWLDERDYPDDVARGHLLVLQTPGTPV
jgi:hypothetical protein